MEEKDYFYYRDRLQIDRNSLDSALIEQPQLVQDVGEAFVLATSERDQLYDEVHRVDADLDREVRDELENELGKKPTEAMVQSSIVAHDEHVDARNEYLEKKKEAEEWRILRDSFMERSRALKELSALYVSGYFAVSNVSGNRSDEVLSDRNKERYNETSKKKGNGRRKSKK